MREYKVAYIRTRKPSGLRSCPFCGGEAIPVCGRILDGKHLCKIRCIECGVETGEYKISINANKAWNERENKMKYAENELLRCKSELRKATGERYSFLYAVQQSLEWAIDPMSCATPVDTVLNDKIGKMDTPISRKEHEVN